MPSNLIRISQKLPTPNIWVAVHDENGSYLPQVVQLKEGQWQSHLTVWPLHAFSHWHALPEEFQDTYNS